MGYSLTTIVTLAAMATYVWTIVNVGKARGQYSIDAPATEGPPEFNCIHRVQVNTAEQLILFLPALWLFATIVGDKWAALLGLVWVAGRIIYARAYYASPPTRAPGMLMTMGTSLVLGLGSLIGVVVGMF